MFLFSTFDFTWVLIICSCKKETERALHCYKRVTNIKFVTKFLLYFNFNFTYEYLIFYTINWKKSDSERNITFRFRIGVCMRRRIKFQKTELTSGERVRCGIRRRKYFIRRDKVTTLFQGFPAKTNEVLRQSGKSSARTAFLRLSSTWIRVVGLKLKKKQHEGTARGLRGRHRSNVSRTNDIPRALQLVSLFRFNGNKILTLLSRFRFAALTKCFRARTLRVHAINLLANRQKIICTLFVLYILKHCAFAHVRLSVRNVTSLSFLSLTFALSLIEN